MGVIRVLPAEIAGRIAAGEVIERPASVIKELVENSIDAGASRVRVLTEQGGQKLMQVIDDGRGMDRQDAMLCLEAHATMNTAKALHDTCLHQAVLNGTGKRVGHVYLLRSGPNRQKIILAIRKHSQHAKSVIGLPRDIHPPLLNILIPPINSLVKRPK